MPIKVLMLIHCKTELLLDILVVILGLWSTCLLACCFTGKRMSPTVLWVAFPQPFFFKAVQICSLSSAMHWVLSPVPRDRGCGTPCFPRAGILPKNVQGATSIGGYHMGNSVSLLQKQFIWVFNIVCQGAKVKLWVTSSSGLTWDRWFWVSLSELGLSSRKVILPPPYSLRTYDSFTCSIS